MRFMLDTNIIAYAINGNPEVVISKIVQHDPADLCISAVTMAELEYGVCNSSKPAQNRLALIMFLSGISVLPFDSLAAREYGELRADLKRKGTPIGANDLMIAAHARALGLTLVTNNTREFERVKGLLLENWAEGKQ